MQNTSEFIKIQNLQERRRSSGLAVVLINYHAHELIALRHIALTYIMSDIMSNRTQIISSEHRTFWGYMLEHPSLDSGQKWRDGG